MYLWAGGLLDTFTQKSLNSTTLVEFWILLYSLCCAEGNLLFITNLQNTPFLFTFRALMKHAEWFPECTSLPSSTLSIRLSFPKWMQNSCFLHPSFVYPWYLKQKFLLLNTKPNLARRWSNFNLLRWYGWENVRIKKRMVLLDHSTVFITTSKPTQTSRI